MQTRPLHQPLDQRGLALAHKAVVNVQAQHPLCAQGAVEQEERHRRIDPTADEQKDVAPLSLLLDPLYGLLGVALHRPTPLSAAERGEVIEDVHAPDGVRYFWMELQAVYLALGVAHCRDRAVLGRAQDGKPRRQRRNVIAMAHPHPLACVQPA